jgi:hypothetical protein
VPFVGAQTLDKWQQVGTVFQFGTAQAPQHDVMHTNFFEQPGVRQLIQTELA